MPITLRDIIEGGGWNPDVQHEGVRPGYGLGTVTGISPRKPYLERTFAPHENATLKDILDNLGEIILAGGAGIIPAGSLPGIGPRGQGRLKPGSRTYRQRMRDLEERIEFEKTAKARAERESAKRMEMSQFDVFKEAYDRGLQDRREGYRGALESRDLGRGYSYPDVYREAYMAGFGAD